MKKSSLRGGLLLCCLGVLLTVFAFAQVAAADPLVVRVQPSGETFAKAYVITGESRIYFGNVEGGTPPYDYKWEFSNGGDTGFAGVGDPRYISIDHSYAAAGTHWARLTVQDATSAQSSATINLQVIAAASDDLNRQKNSAVDRGLRYNYSWEQVTADGSWWPGDYSPIPTTGMALIAFENHGHNLQSPDTDIYKKSVQEGVRYLMNNAYDLDLSNQPCIGDPEDGDGDSDHDGKGVVFSPDGHSGSYGDEMYIDPIAVLAIVNSCDKATAQATTVVTTDAGRFVNGQTLWDVIVDAKDFLAYAQNDNETLGKWNYWECNVGNGSVYLETTGLSVTWVDLYKWMPPWTTEFAGGEGFGAVGRVADSVVWLEACAYDVPPGGQFRVVWGDGSEDSYYDSVENAPNACIADPESVEHTYGAPGAYILEVWYEEVRVAYMVAGVLETCPGTFTIDWGDGSPPEDYAGNPWDCPWSASLNSGGEGGGFGHDYAGGGVYPVTVRHDGEVICTVDVDLTGAVLGPCGVNGWRYERNYWDADNSVSQWPVLALEEARSRWGINVNPAVITEVDGWLEYDQSADGGFGYTGPRDWVNFPKTGAGVCMLRYCGYDETNARMQNALAYLDANWGSENLDHYYGMYAFYKAMKYLNKADLNGRDWEEEYTQFLVNDQIVVDCWQDAGGWYDTNFATSTALAILAPAIAGLPPVADAGGPYPDVNPGQAVNLDGSGSYHQDPAKNLVKYEWDFNADDGLWWTSKPAPGAGEGAVGISPTTSYPDVGVEKTYAVTLRVTDNSLPPETDTDTATVKVASGNVAPVAVTNGPWTGLPGEELTFDGSASYDSNACTTPGDPSCLGDSIVSYEWDLDGDGVFNEPGDDGTPVTPGDYRIVKKSYPTPISLSAVLRVTDSYGLSSTSAAQTNIVSIAIVYGTDYETCFREQLSRFEERRGIIVKFKNLGSGAAENLVMTLTSVPTNLQILKGVSNLGTLNPGEEKLTACNPGARSADIELKFDRRIVPTGQWRWKAEFDLSGHHYIVDNIPPLAP